AKGGQQFAFDDGLDLVRAEQREDDGSATPGEIGGGRSRPAAKLRELGDFGGIDVEANDLEAGLQQAMGKRLAQQTDANKAYRFSIWHEPHPSQTAANRRHLSHARAAYVLSRSRGRDIEPSLRPHQPSAPLPEPPPATPQPW